MLINQIENQENQTENDKNNKSNENNNNIIKKNNDLLLLINDLKQKHNFDKCNELLRKEIIYIYTKKVQKYCKGYLYSTPIELLESLKLYFKYDEYAPFAKFINISFNDDNDECMDFEKTEKLLNLYNSIFD